MPWKNRAMQDVEEARPPVRAQELQRAASSYKASTGVGSDGLHSTVSLDLGNETCWESGEFSVAVVQCGNYPVQAKMLLFFLIPKDVTIARRIACCRLSLDGGDG